MNRDQFGLKQTFYREEDQLFMRENTFKLKIVLEENSKK